MDTFYKGSDLLVEIANLNIQSPSRRIFWASNMIEGKRVFSTSIEVFGDNFWSSKLSHNKLCEFS